MRRALVFVMLLTVMPLMAQRREVAGRITDASGKPLLGVTVELLQNGETLRSASSDEEGFIV